MILGDVAGFVNVFALKGIHYVMWLGILVVCIIFEVLKVDNVLSEKLRHYDDCIRESVIYKDLYPVCNMC